GRYGDIVGVWIAPVTAQGMMTLFDVAIAFRSPSLAFPERWLDDFSSGRCCRSGHGPARLVIGENGAELGVCGPPGQPARVRPENAIYVTFITKLGLNPLPGGPD